jgi:glyoxylase-like metal-dependent hydrolase (beta-lactamase superfamily II)
MADESEPNLFADTRTEPPRELTRLSPRVRRLIAPNASAFTFNGTCTYIVGEGAVAVVDPGPADQIHLAAILSAVAGDRVEAIIVTHTHRDHSALANELRQATGARVVGPPPFQPQEDGAGLDSSHDRGYAPDSVLADGERLSARTFTIEAVATPGHCGNHLCLALLDERALFSGDHVMAWSTSVVAAPDGSMSAYMASLEKVRVRDETIYWPGHGGPVLEPQRYVRALALHRRQREASILAALESGAETVPELVARVYVGLDPSLLRAAGLSTLAHLEDLRERGVVVGDGSAPEEPRFRRA